MSPIAIFPVGTSAYILLNPHMKEFPAHWKLQLLALKGVLYVSIVSMTSASPSPRSTKFQRFHPSKDATSTERVIEFSCRASARSVANVAYTTAFPQLFEGSKSKFIPCAPYSPAYFTVYEMNSCCRVKLPRRIESPVQLFWSFCTSG